MSMFVHGKHMVVLFMLVSTGMVQAQEICNNGLDDDGDGLIDLHDTLDCPCTQVGPSALPSLLPNPSFEEFVNCPPLGSLISTAVGWSDVTLASTDYFNTCGSTFEAGPAGLLPFPDGEGVIGMALLPTFVEYVGGCLSSGLIAGREYTFTIDLALTSYDPSLPPGQSLCPPVDGLLPNLAYTVFGSASCVGLPLNTLICPLAADPAWSVLGSSVYTPSSDWTRVSISFTPTIDIQAVIIGPPCFIPPAYGDYVDDTSCYPYFYADRLLIEETFILESPIAGITTDPCAVPVEMTAEFSASMPSGTQLQWYKDGVAINGENGSTYTLPTGAESWGQYQLSASFNGSCALSAPIEVEDLAAEAIILGAPAGNVAEGTVVELTNGSNADLNWTWVDCTDSTSMASTYSLIATAERCCVTLLTSSSSCSDSAQVCIETSDDAEPLISNVFTPNGDGSNDFFEVGGSGVLVCSIYDRWGLQVFHGEGREVKWNGEDAGGEAASGTYFYVISMDGPDGGTRRSGHLTLLR
jgi:gliding motility-associated-like protein